MMTALTNVELMAAVADHRPVPTPAPEVGVRFAVYGRMSTSEFQDLQTSRAWQRAVSDELIDGIGLVVAEFFDVGVSRRWARRARPEAAALLTAAADPARAFDAVVLAPTTPTPSPPQPLQTTRLPTHISAAAALTCSSVMRRSG